MLTLLGCLVIFKVNIEGLKKLFSLTKLDAIKGLIIWHRWKFLFFFRNCLYGTARGYFGYLAPLVLECILTMDKCQLMNFYRFQVDVLDLVVI